MQGGNDEELEPLSEDVQGPVGMELMCLLNYGNPQTWAHSDVIMHFGQGESFYKIRGRDIVPHVEKQLRHMREFLRAEVAAGRPAFSEAQVEDSLDDWTIRYGLGADGSISKLYINADTPGDSVVVSLDASDVMVLPAHAAGEEFMLLGGNAAIVEALRAAVVRALEGAEE